MQAVRYLDKHGHFTLRFNGNQVSPNDFFTSTFNVKVFAETFCRGRQYKIIFVPNVDAYRPIRPAK
jgi:hypothetical protein